MTGPLYLAIDQGGHASRAAVVDETGAVRAMHAVGTTTDRPADDRVEHDAEGLVRSVDAAIGGVLDAVGDDVGRIRSAGLATQRSSIALWERDSGRPLAPVISWQDRRPAAWLATLAAHETDVLKRTGLRLSPHYGAGKLRWCLDHLPEAVAALDDGRLAAGPLASFLVARLTGQTPCVVDPANASRTLLWSLSDADWDDHLLALFGIPRDILPHTAPTMHAYGDLAGGTPLRVCTGDQSAAIYADGVPADDTILVNLGTGGFIQRPVRGWPAKPNGLLVSVVRGEGSTLETVLEGTINGAGCALDEVARELGLEHAKLHEQLEAWLTTETEPPLFLNGVSGLAAPFWVPGFPTRFHGEGSDRQKIVAVIESIVFLVRIILDAMRRSGAPPAARIYLTGGLARSDALCRRLASLTGLVVDRPDLHEATVRGVAFLVAGEPASWRPSASSTFEAEPDAALSARFARWERAMRALAAASR